MAGPSATWRNLYLVAVALLLLATFASTMTVQQKHEMRDKVKEMFQHGYMSYMKYAYPADELMPLSCKGRYRGSEADRGDIDEVLGNYSLTLVDTLDTLAVLGEVEEFERAVKLVTTTVRFDTDAVVSVFEANIRVLGGLLGGHIMSLEIKSQGLALKWYNNELLSQAVDLADRLLAAFNTSTGIPYPKVNLRYGIHHPSSRLGSEQDTCTACAGTMIMEFAALSRLSGNPIYEAKARKAMEAIWKFRSHHSDLVGTVINIHNGDWIRRDSGVGAGIDSYYEYCFKAYVLLGDESYLEKFNKHYAAVKKYLHHGVMWLDVLMHQPERPVRMFMDALQAFWPGLQVMLGDLKPAIETHHMLYEVAKKHKFLPEAFTTNLEVYWGQHPLRPEFAESTYFLYEATKDPHYLEVGKHIVESLEDYARVPCGYAAVKDVRTFSKEDKMDSFVLAETFKYLYLLFSEESERIIDIHDYVLTTEAHLLPLSLSSIQPMPGNSSESQDTQSSVNPNKTSNMLLEDDVNSACPNSFLFQGSLVSYAETIRREVKLTDPSSSCSRSTTPDPRQVPAPEVIISSKPLLKAEEFQFDNAEHLKILKDMGINSMILDGRVQLMHQAGQAISLEQAHHGIKFMQDMIIIAKEKAGPTATESVPRVVQVLSHPHNGNIVFSAGPASFGHDLTKTTIGVSGRLIEANPLRGCTKLQNSAILNSIVLMERGDCMFIDKVRIAQAQGAIGIIIVDSGTESSSDTQQAFSMSGDDHADDVRIAAVFLFAKEGNLLQQYLADATERREILEVRLAEKAFYPERHAPINPSPQDGKQSTTDGPDTSTCYKSQSQACHVEKEAVKNSPDRGGTSPSTSSTPCVSKTAIPDQYDKEEEAVYLKGFTNEIYVPPEGSKWKKVLGSKDKTQDTLLGQWKFQTNIKFTVNGKPLGEALDDATSKTIDITAQASKLAMPQDYTSNSDSDSIENSECADGLCTLEQEALKAMQTIDKLAAEDLSRQSNENTNDQSFSNFDNSDDAITSSDP